MRGKARPDAENDDYGGVFDALVEAGRGVCDLIFEFGAHGLKAFEDGRIGGCESWFDMELEDLENSHLCSGEWGRD